MKDQEWNDQETDTAEAIRSHNIQVETGRRKAVNAYARTVGLIDDQEDLVNQYRGQGLQQMKAVEDYFDGNKRDWEEVQKAIDAIADSQSSGFADKVLEKWFGDYTLPTALWKDKVRGEPDVNHNKRKTLAAVGGFLGGGALTASVYDAFDGEGSAAQSTGGVSTQAIEYNISNLDRLSTYLEDAVIGNKMLEQEWGSLLANYDAESNEFFPDEDINLESIDVVYDDSPGGDSGYRTTADLNGRSQKSDWIYFEHDETAKNALEHFGEL
jgi:hypothetical protein